MCREWFQGEAWSRGGRENWLSVGPNLLLALSSELTKPEHGAFVVGDAYRLSCNPAADPETLRFVGLLCGLAVYHGMLVHLSFTPVVFKWMLGHTLDDAVGAHGCGHIGLIDCGAERMVGGYDATGG